MPLREQRVERLDRLGGQVAGLCIARAKKRE
jgi:hypothetical protein